MFVISSRSVFACLFLFLLLPASVVVSAQEKYRHAVPITVMMDSGRHRVVVKAGGQPFTEFLYPDSLEKPVLYPIVASDGQTVTRGFPLEPRRGEPVDHPHHVGLWFNYENVNGLDFWNNSYAIPASKKASYGWIRTDSIIRAGVTKDNQGDLQYMARWTDQAGHVLLNEVTTYIFSAGGNERIIDRTTRLTATEEVDLPDNKDGLLGLRVTRELQIPSKTPGEFIDNKGNITKVAAGDSPDINGNYLTSEGKEGDSAWGTRGAWCMLYGKKQGDWLSLVLIDHPSNPGYPTYWHARGYGLFAANPLGQKVFSNGKQVLGYHLKKGETAVFRYRIVINAGSSRMSTGRIRRLADAFAAIKTE